MELYENGWHPTANDPETLRTGIELLHQELEKQGRDVSDVPISKVTVFGSP